LLFSCQEVVTYLGLDVEGEQVREFLLEELRPHIFRQLSHERLDVKVRRRLSPVLLAVAAVPAFQLAVGVVLERLETDDILRPDRFVPVVIDITDREQFLVR
jgi:hypothetical protein